MDAFAVAISLALPWLLGVALLSALDWPAATEEPGRVALRAGFGYVVGAIVLTLWMRGLSLAGIGFGRASVGFPLFLVASGWLALSLRNGRLSVAQLRSAARTLLASSLPRWQRVAWIAVLVWLTVHVALMAAEIAWRPLYPWDAWVQWATKARVWYELGRLVPFVHAEQWLSSAGGAYFDASPNYPATVPLLQVWTCVV